MRVCKRGGQMLVTTAGAFAAFSLMTVAVGTDYWLYSRGVCQTKSTNDNDSSHKNEEVLTHSGLWRTCCMEGTFTGVCKEIDHFPEESDYEQDAGEYLLRAVRASSVFPILSVGLQFTGGVCVAASEFYKTRYNVILSAGILFVSAGLSNIIGIIVYISAAAGDPNQSESKRSHWYGWSFYCGAFSFVVTEMVGVLAVHLFIDAHRRLRAANPSLRTHVLHTHTRSRSHPLSRSSNFSRRSSSYRSRYRRRPSRMSETRHHTPPHSRQSSLWRPAALPADLLPLYAVGYSYTHPATHTHSGPSFSGLPHTHSHTHTNSNSLHHNNSLPHAYTHTLARTRDSVKSDGSFDNTHTHVHTLPQNSLESHTHEPMDIPHAHTHTQNNVTSNSTHTHTQNSVKSDKGPSHIHNSVKENTHTVTPGGHTQTGTATRRTTPV